MTKYKEFFQLMLDKNRGVFDEFTKLHNKYVQDQEKYQEEFNKVGEKVQKVIREWEQKLCNRSEGSGYAKFTGGLSEKFWGEARSMYPMIDHIGVKIKKFDIKKVKLF